MTQPMTLRVDATYAELADIMQAAARVSSLHAGLIGDDTLAARLAFICRVYSASPINNKKDNEDKIGGAA